MGADSCIFNITDLKTPIICGIRTFEVTLNRNIFAIAADNYAGDYFLSKSVTVGGLAYNYIVYPRSSYSNLIIRHEVPIYVNADGVFTSFSNQCVKDVSLGVDGTLWALSCTKSGDDYIIIKWDNFSKTWYTVPNMQGIAIAAWNEISAAVVTSAGAVYVSSLPENKTQSYLDVPNLNTTDPFFESVILNATSKTWLLSQLNGSVTGRPNLLYRGGRDGYVAAVYHAKCDNKGAILTVIATTKRNIFGGFAKVGFNGASGWLTDPNAFAFNID